jgi:hypothetical protein
VDGQWYWGDRVLYDLEAMLAAVRTLDAELRARDKNDHFRGILEQMLNVGMDDGAAQARLTLIGLPRRVGDPSRVRVDVLTTTAKYGPGVKFRELPRYAPSDDPPAVEQPEPSDYHKAGTRAVAEYLFGRSGGEPESLRPETGGAVSFTVVISQ